MHAHTVFTLSHDHYRPACDYYIRINSCTPDHIHIIIHGHILYTHKENCTMYNNIPHAFAQQKRHYHSKDVQMKVWSQIQMKKGLACLLKSTLEKKIIVEPLYNGHHWGTMFWPLYRGGLC